MLPLLFVALFQTVADGQTPSRDARPVRVWLGSNSVLTRGTPVRVYVQAAQDGNLIVLHRRTDGRIDVLFPSKPTDDPFVRAGTYEIQRRRAASPSWSRSPTARDWCSPRWRPGRIGSTSSCAPRRGTPTRSRRLGRLGQRGRPLGHRAAHARRRLFQLRHRDVHRRAAGLRDAAGHGVQYPMYPTCTDCTFIGFQQNVFEPWRCAIRFLALHRRRRSTRARPAFVPVAPCARRHADSPRAGTRRGVADISGSSLHRRRLPRHTADDRGREGARSSPVQGASSPHPGQWPLGPGRSATREAPARPGSPPACRIVTASPSAARRVVSRTTATRVGKTAAPRTETSGLAPVDRPCRVAPVARPSALATLVSRRKPLRTIQRPQRDDAGSDSGRQRAPAERRARRSTRGSRSRRRCRARKTDRTTPGARTRSVGTR